MLYSIENITRLARDRLIKREHPFLVEAVAFAERYHRFDLQPRSNRLEASVARGTAPSDCLLLLLVRQTLQRSAPVDARTTSPPSFRFSFLVSRRSISPPRLPSLSCSEDLGSGWQRDASMIRWSELPPRDVDESRTTVVDYWRRRVSMILVE